MIRTIAIFALCIAYVQARNTSFTNCSPNGKIYNVNVVPCDTDPCKIQSGEVVSITGSFVSSIAASSPLLTAEARIGNTWIQYPGIDTDGCKYFNCPLEVDVVYPYGISLEVIDFPQSIDTVFRFRLLSNDGSTLLVCGETPITVIAA
ncbi:NPC intracellular cholesterol transporter 2 [Tetranychus urticae]|uniref:MD-2-related lipid-recognition domain-containing protein n=1 Tax=Tetranychus urticae TaxID=32264 RepID=T1KLA0_TETUR|nr:NPC intracellular cholesterol transporter 2 [Tetranychus urticae]